MLAFVRGLALTDAEAVRKLEVDGAPLSLLSFSVCACLESLGVSSGKISLETPWGQVSPGRQCPELERRLLRPTQPVLQDVLCRQQEDPPRHCPIN